MHASTTRTDNMCASVIRFIRYLLVMLTALAACHAQGALASEQVVNVPLDEGASISYLLTQQDGSQPHWVLVMFPGSEGKFELLQQPDGSIHMREKNNFLRTYARRMETDGFRSSRRRKSSSMSCLTR